MDSNRQMEEEKTCKQVDESVALNVTNSAGDLNHRRSAAREGGIIFQLLRQKVISIRKVDTKDEFADLFTKALSNPEFHGFFRHFLYN
jgi:hypothetical protein